MNVADEQRDDDMSDDNLVLQAVLEEHGVSVKQLAAGVGRTAMHCYRYLAGGQTIPSVVWRWLYAQTKDARIIELLTAGSGVVMVPIEARKAVDKLAYRDLVEQRREELRCEDYVMKIVADGKIDAADRKAIDAYKQNFPQMIRTQAMVFHAVTGGHVKAVSL
jgi:hypothetical protein